MKIAIFVIIGIILLMALGGGIFLIGDLIYYRNKEKEDAINQNEPDNVDDIA
ncbi:MAG: hypothetical protein J5525_05850 [Lachnospiraceae bacterium]|nr:hypothetical protein [Lachnospiraceae bacterium]